MKKIGIMTWYKYRNYGTALQASALFYIIKKLGYDPELINYKPRGAATQNYKVNFQLIVRKALNKLKNHGMKLYENQNRTKLFDDFLSVNTVISKKSDTYPELYMLNKEYNAFVCGSDQIWSPLCFDANYFLPFVEDPDKMVAYAPSLGCTVIKDEKLSEKIKDLISRFAYLSVREKQGVELIQKLTSKNAKLVLDPTLLIDKNEWSKTIENISYNKKIKGDYILCYFLGDFTNYIKTVKKIKNALKLPVYVIPTFENQSNKVPFEVGPAEFVSLFKNAKYVCTDSFHGISFSINFNVPFTAFKRFKDNDPKNQNSRVFSILELTHLEKRLFNGKDVVFDEKIQNCDFSYANKAIDKLRIESVDYLKTSLQNASESISKSDKTFNITDMCCGCGACAAACKNEAITIKKDDNGFEQCLIDSERCIQCGRCKQVCPFVNVTAASIKDSKALYSYKTVDDEVLSVSSSGGIGYQLAKMCCENDYNVFGCEYDDKENRAKHSMVSKKNILELSKFQGSKYIQSRTSEVFKSISDYNQDDKFIFFGTPCQVAAIDKMMKFKKMRENVILVDLICHGVPSQLIWDKHIAEVCEKYKIKKNPQVAFRAKTSEWHTRVLKISDGINTYAKTEAEDNFYALFRRNLGYMDTCFECPYREKSASDIRIGDYWGARFQDDKKGVSMVIANTDNGDKILKQLEVYENNKLTNHSIEEYWSVQYPTNSIKPIFFNQVIEELKNPNLKLSDIRNKYCALYDFSEKVSKIKKQLKKF